MNLLVQELVGVHRADLLADAEASRRSRPDGRRPPRWTGARRRRNDRPGRPTRRAVA